VFYKPVTGHNYIVLLLFIKGAKLWGIKYLFRPKILRNFNTAQQKNLALSGRKMMKGHVIILLIQKKTKINSGINTVKTRVVGSLIIVNLYPAVFTIINQEVGYPITDSLLEAAED
jgi:hypothetical protein